MNQENRNKVNNYLNSEYVESLSPLYFNGYESPKNEFSTEKYNIEKMIERTLELSREYSSYDAGTKELDCYSGRWRSSIDIWRHIIYYFPDVTIFDVMNNLYNMYDKTIKGQYCTSINRRTFKLGRGDGSNYMKPESMILYASTKVDEYELVWDDWKKI